MNPLDLLSSGNSITRLEPTPASSAEPEQRKVALRKAAPGSLPSVVQQQAPEGDSDRVASRYFIEQSRSGERRYYADIAGTQLAFRADDKIVSTRREDQATIRDMLDVAQARNWTEIHLRGSAAFKQEAWIEGVSRGLTVKGHQPTEVDRQEADRRKAMREHPAEKMDNAIERADPSPAQAVSSGSTTQSPPVPVQAPQKVADLSPGAREALAFIDQRLAAGGAFSDATRSELRAFAAAELAAKEAKQGPIVTPKRAQSPKKTDDQAPKVTPKADKQRLIVTQPQPEGPKPRV